MKKHKENIEKLKMSRDFFYEVHFQDPMLLKGGLYEGGLYEEQIAISDAIIEQVYYGHVGQSVQDIYVNISRQFGKSFIVFSMIAFILIYFPKVLGKPMTVGITINKKDQVTKNYGEVRELLQICLPVYKMKLTEDSKTSLKLSNGSKIVIFSMESKHNEGETLDFSVVDEAQELLSEKYEKEIFPMLSRTGGVSCFVGVGGYFRNGYYEGLNNDSNIIFKYTADQLIKTVQKRYEETGDFRHLLYLNNLEKARGKMTKVGFSTQYMLEWVLGVGTFINIDLFRSTKKTFEELQKEYQKKNEEENREKKVNGKGNEKLFAFDLGPVSVGIDWGQMGDRTVVTTSGYCNTLKKAVVLDIMYIEDAGVSYMVQIERIAKRLLERDYHDKIKQIFTDASGVGTAVKDILKSKFTYLKIIPITFSEITKDEMATNFINMVDKDSEPDLICLSKPETEEKFKKLEFELENLEKRYTRSGKISFKHPDKGDIHDDFCDSLFLSLLWFGRRKNTSGIQFGNI